MKLSNPTEFEAALWSNGFASLGQVLNRDECEEVRGLYEDAELFRSRIVMAQYRFGSGEYQYFRYPLPKVVEELREQLYARLARIAGAWMGAMGLRDCFPPTHAEFIEECRAAGQMRPTPLLLRYRPGDYNCLHQDVYGPVVFPFQAIVALSAPEREYRGGELMLVEQQPRAQSKGHVIRLQQGECCVITTRYRPVRGARSTYRVNVRHGVSTVHEGERFTLGVIFHDAE